MLPASTCPERGQAQLHAERTHKVRATPASTLPGTAFCRTFTAPGCAVPTGAVAAHRHPTMALSFPVGFPKRKRRSEGDAVQPKQIRSLQEMALFRALRTPNRKENLALMHEYMRGLPGHRVLLKHVDGVSRELETPGLANVLDALEQRVAVCAIERRLKSLGHLVLRSDQPLASYKGMDMDLRTEYCGLQGVQMLCEWPSHAKVPYSSGDLSSNYIDNVVVCNFLPNAEATVRLYGGFARKLTDHEHGYLLHYRGDTYWNGWRITVDVEHFIEDAYVTLLYRRDELFEKEEDILEEFGIDPNTLSSRPMGPGLPSVRSFIHDTFDDYILDYPMNERYLVNACLSVERHGGSF